MAITKLTIQEFLQMAGQYPVLDVRSPGEFKHAHIPGANSMPLFSDEERKIVGTAYKQESREKAIKIGLTFFGTKMVQMVEEAEKIVATFQLQFVGKKSNSNPTAADKNIIVHCWRGGMRSAGVAWLLDLYGFKVYTIVGGYKVYRKWALEQFEKQYPLCVIGGYTGSGKTGLLHALKSKGENTIDLEALAQHKGSAFGSLGELPQPSQEMFENMLALELHQKNIADKLIWIEDESQRIGNVNIPAVLYRNKQTSPLYFVDISFEERLNHIVAGYGKFERDQLVNAIIRIKKRLGGLETKTAINYLIEDDIKNCFAVLLKYYDKWYLKSLLQRQGPEKLITKIPCAAVESNENAEKILQSCIVEKSFL